jgi:hypothetical protein
MQELSKWPMVLADKQQLVGSSPYYVPLRAYPANQVFQRDPKYIDQIYVFQSVPGLKIPIRKFYSTSDLASQALEVIDQAKSRYNSDGLVSLSANSSIDAKYLKYMDFVAGKLHALERGDNVIVLGSFNDQANANQRVDDLMRTINFESISSELFIGPISIKVEPREGSGIYAVEIVPALKDSEAKVVLAKLKDAGVTDIFVSRPRVP